MTAQIHDKLVTFMSVIETKSDVGGDYASYSPTPTPIQRVTMFRRSDAVIVNVCSLCIHDVDESTDATSSREPSACGLNVPF